MSKLCGEIINDHTGIMEWGYAIYIDGEYVGGRKHFGTKFVAKLFLKRAIRKWPPPQPYKICRTINAPNPRRK